MNAIVLLFSKAFGSSQPKQPELTAPGPTVRLFRTTHLETDFLQVEQRHGSIFITNKETGDRIEVLPDATHGFIFEWNRD